MKTFNIGIKGVIVRDDKVLLLKSTDGYWEFPGGRMEDGEDIQDTLLRELGEELPNIQNVVIHETLAAFKIKHEYKPPLALMLIFYRVSADFDGEPQISEEHTEYKWAGKDEALELAEEASKQAIMSVFGD